MARLFTLGHSTRSLDEHLALLREHGIGCLIDVRRFPGSRRHPHFAREALAAALEGPTVGIEYLHEEDLGGYRKPQPNSPNTAWRVKGFQAYADHMHTPTFREALKRVVHRAERTSVAIMCAEATPWRCHRQLIADALVAQGHEVIHILRAGRTETHQLNEHARVQGDGRLVYPTPAPEQRRLFSDDQG